jgi:dienelactone hydrolase
MQFRLLFSIIFSVFILQSCSSGNNKSKTPLPEANKAKDTIVSVKENFQKGQIIEQVVCKSDASQNYSMYLPATYSIEKKYPVIFAFDAHGDGKLPVSLYKDLAEQYGFIIIGSNNSKNGTSWAESQTIADKLFSDAEDRLSLNTQRIYVLGFSGGARIANGLVISNGLINAAICCGASNPAGTNNQTRTSSYAFMGIGGNEDFNYTEMCKYDLVDLAGKNVKHVLLTFNGKHAWPPKDVMAEGFLWLELNDMRGHISTKNDTLIANHFTPELKQLKVYQQKKQVYEEYELCRKTINFYDGLTDLSVFLSEYKLLQQNVEVDKQLRQNENIWKKEETMKQQYIQALQTQDFAWWQKDIAALNQKIKTGKNKNEVLTNKRMLDFLSLAAYMQSSGALKQNTLPAAEFFCKIYVLVDPTNNEAHYLTASVNAEKGNTKDAINSLNLAVKNGFADITRLQNDSAFASLKGTKEFEEVITKINRK